jgi:hypothetical protein
MIQSKDDQNQRSYGSYEDYLRRFYGAAEQKNYSTLSLESSFGKKIAKRALEVEATEKSSNCIDQTA